MDKETLSLRSNLTNNANAIHTNGRETTGTDGTSLLRPAGSETITQTTSSEFVLQWGNRKRLRCMKVQVKDNDPTAPAQRTTVRVDRRVVRADKDSLSQPGGGNHGNGYLNLRQRHPSPQPPPPPPPSQRILRNSEASGAMRGQSNGVARGIASPDRGGAHDKRGNQANNHSINLHHHHHHNNHNENNKSAASSETAHDSKKGGGSSSGSGEAIPPVWPPKFVIALTNKEKEEDFMAIKGSKLPQRPKKRAKFIQRTLNLVSPGAWLCDLTLERYEVREKKISKKRPRGLKAMGNMDSDSE
ncbi:la-related protein Larp4B-like [Juglans microcarpa x Juglans regia]|uniref:la-related protein Larp4B-like n=1 Tax=Juglans microcarpa x Juglans regia TaxID=2249226 RepID=UPI001B7E6498|nr:la-related protein Larp4B-like [Juglans microcarpa x Juglans regia]XP_040997437.1 la-related protein Larp4B-like [Juglans microcarpa x Juglans regia]